MKIKPKQYALALYESIDGQSASQVKVVIKKFVELLADKRQLIKADQIIAEFKKIWNQKRGVIEAQVTSANELSQEMVKLLNSYIAKLSGAKEVVISRRINKAILGGVVIRYGDRVLDGSLKMQLEELKSKLIK